VQPGVAGVVERAAYRPVRDKVGRIRARRDTGSIIIETVPTACRLVLGCRLVSLGSRTSCRVGV